MINVKPLTPQESFASALSSINKSFEGILKVIDDFENSSNLLEYRINELTELLAKEKAKNQEHADFISSITPVQVYHHKKRRNTTVVFLDKSSVTVKRRPRDKDCIETAIAYALTKKLYSKQVIKYLVKNCKEVGEEQCEKI